MIGCRILASWTTLKSVTEIRNPDMLIRYPQNMVRYVDLKELIRFLWNVPEICPVGWRTMKASSGDHSWIYHHNYQSIQLRKNEHLCIITTGVRYRPINRVG